MLFQKGGAKSKLDLYASVQYEYYLWERQTKSYAVLTFSKLFVFGIMKADKEIPCTLVLYKQMIMRCSKSVRIYDVVGTLSNECHNMFFSFFLVLFWGFVQELNQAD